MPPGHLCSSVPGHVVFGRPACQFDPCTRVTSRLPGVRAAHAVRPAPDNPRVLTLSFQYFAGAACRALTARKDGPSLYEVCDPILRQPGNGDPHLAKFYRTALGNPALRTLLRRAGLPELNDPAALNALRQALVLARDNSTPDCEAVGRPVAELVDSITLRHPAPPRRSTAV